MHKISKFVVDYCKHYNITNIIIGYNEKWKQEIGLRKATNQNFVNIPYHKFLQQLTYKAMMFGIRVIQTEESYTSGTSFLDNEEPIKENYNKKRRIKRGMFKSNDGILINSDVNGAYQISKKIQEFSKAFANVIEGVVLHPIRANIA